MGLSRSLCVNGVVTLAVIALAATVWSGPGEALAAKSSAQKDAIAFRKAAVKRTKALRKSLRKIAKGVSKQARGVAKAVPRKGTAEERFDGAAAAYSTWFELEEEALRDCDSAYREALDDFGALFTSHCDGQPAASPVCREAEIGSGGATDLFRHGCSEETSDFYEALAKAHEPIKRACESAGYPVNRDACGYGKLDPPTLTPESFGDVSGAEAGAILGTTATCELVRICVVDHEFYRGTRITLIDESGTTVASRDNGLPSGTRVICVDFEDVPPGRYKVVSGGITPLGDDQLGSAYVVVPAKPETGDPGDPGTCTASVATGKFDGQSRTFAGLINSFVDRDDNGKVTGLDLVFANPQQIPDGVLIVGAIANGKELDTGPLVITLPTAIDAPVRVEIFLDTDGSPPAEFVASGGTVTITGTFADSGKRVVGAKFDCDVTLQDPNTLATIPAVFEATVCDDVFAPDQ